MEGRTEEGPKGGREWKEGRLVEGSPVTGSFSLAFSRTYVRLIGASIVGFWDEFCFDKREGTSVTFSQEDHTTSTSTVGIMKVLARR